MKTLFFSLVFILTLFGCGYSSVNSEVVGQVKKVSNKNPLICPAYTAADVSLGVMRNGTGSISQEDMWFYVGPQFAPLFTEAQEKGSLVKIHYNTHRLTLCVDETREVVKIEVLQ